MHLAVAGRLPDPLAVVALDAVVAYKGIVTYQQADVKQDTATHLPFIRDHRMVSTMTAMM